MTTKQNEILEYKSIILNALDQSAVLYRLLGRDPGEAGSGSLEQMHLFPYEYIPQPDQTPDCFLCFDVKTRLNSNKSFKDLTVSFYISSHISKIHTPDGLRTDLIAAETEQLIRALSVHKTGRTHRLGNGLFTVNMPYCPSPEYRGRLLTLRLPEYGKSGQ